MTFKIDFATKNKEVIAKYVELFSKQLTIVPRSNLESHQELSKLHLLNVGVIAFDEKLSQKFCDVLSFDQYYYSKDLLSLKLQQFHPEKHYDFVIYLVDATEYNRIYGAIEKPQRACIVVLSSPGKNKIHKKELEQKANELNVSNFIIIQKSENDSKVYVALRYLITAEIYKRSHQEFYDRKDALLKLEKIRLKANLIHYQSIERSHLISSNVTLNIKKLLQTVDKYQYSNQIDYNLLRHVNDFLANPRPDMAEKIKNYANELANLHPDHSMEAKIATFTLTLIGFLTMATLWKRSENVIASVLWWGGTLITGAMSVNEISMFTAPRNKLTENIIKAIDGVETQAKVGWPSIRMGK